MNLVTLDTKNLNKFNKLNNTMKNLIVEEETKINLVSSNQNLLLEQNKTNTTLIEYGETSEEVIEKLKIEELEELNKILADLDAIHEINKLLVEHLQEQKENLKNVEDSVIKTNDTLDISNLELVHAKNDQVSHFYTKTSAVVLVTAVVTCPVTWIVGIKAGLIAGVASLVTGLTVSTAL